MSETMNEQLSPSLPTADPVPAIAAQGSINSKSCEKYKTRWWCSKIGIVVLMITASVGAVYCVRHILRTARLDSRRNSSDEHSLPPWEPGMLDIHHLHVGPSQSSFVIFPDGTTMLIDAGDIDLPRALPRFWQNGRRRLKIRPPYPNSSKSTAEWIVSYIHHFWPRPGEYSKVLDYFLLTHFESDHMGDPGPDCPVSEDGSYRLSGVTEVASLISIDKIVDRAYPQYNFPIDLYRWPSKAFKNYRRFIESRISSGIDQIEKFNVGSTSQFIEKRTQSDHFQIRNLKSNLDVVDVNGDVVQIQGELFTDADKYKWNENELSCAVVIEYGAFRYYEGGDQESRASLFGQMDTITPTAKAAGLVDVATANHHGEGVNQVFIDELDPTILILQGIFSDQPLESAMEFMTRDTLDRKKRILLATDIYEESLKAINGHSNAFSSIKGHVVLRVYEPGPTQYYEVYVLDSEKRVKSRLGPFKPRANAGL